MSEKPHTSKPAITRATAALTLGLLGLLAIIVMIGRVYGGSWLDRIAATEPSAEGRAAAERLREGKQLLSLPTPEQTD